MRLMSILFGAFLTVVSFSEARAQFLGDVFFETPSILASNGEEVILKVAVFTGTEVFGSADFTLSFDESLFEVKEVGFHNDISGVKSLETDKGLTKLRILAANGTSVDKPSGIVSIADIKGTVLAPSGANISISPENHNIFLANKTEITNGGLGVEIIVQSSRTKISVARSSSPTLVEAKPGSDLYQRAKKLRHEGEIVRLHEPDGSFIDVLIFQEEK